MNEPHHHHLMMALEKILSRPQFAPIRHHFEDVTYADLQELGVENIVGNTLKETQLMGECLQASGLLEVLPEGYNIDPQTLSESIDPSFRFASEEVLTRVAAKFDEYIKKIK